MELTIFLPDLTATQTLACQLGPLLRPGDLIALHGDLGAGKTTLARALIQGLNPDEVEVPSPTFTLVQLYDSPSGPLAHLDLYRLSDPSEIVALGWDDLRAGIMLVEWPERAGNLLPASRIDASLSYGPQEDTRILNLTLDAPRARVLKEIRGEL